jgi:hypothetical protein
MAVVTDTPIAFRIFDDNVLVMFLSIRKSQLGVSASGS